MPWSAVTTNRVSSYMPCSWSRRMTWPISRSVSPVCMRWRWRDSWGGQGSLVQPLALRPSPRSVYLRPSGR